MTATTKDRQTTALYIEREIALKPKANIQVPAGVIVMVVVATGLAENATDTAGTKVAGRSAHAFDNTAAQVPPDEFLIVETGVFAFTPSAEIIALGDAALLTTVYVLDNQTFTTAAVAANDIPLGRLEEIKDGKYYVAIGLGATSA